MMWSFRVLLVEVDEQGKRCGNLPLPVGPVTRTNPLMQAREFLQSGSLAVPREDGRGLVWKTAATPYF
jgi:hypothetical protein